MRWQQSIRIRSVDSFWQPGVDPAVLRMRHEAYSALRHEKMKSLRDARRAIINEENDGGAHSSRSPGKSALGGTKDTARSAAIAGAIDIEKVKKKQQKEIEAMMAYEMKMQEIAEEQERREVCVVGTSHGVNAHSAMTLCCRPCSAVLCRVPHVSCAPTRVCHCSASGRGKGATREDGARACAAAEEG
jgi:hypothetical protein